MSSPVERIKVRCPGCGMVYDDWDRASVTPEMAADADYMRRVTTATCPACGHVATIRELVVDRDGVRHAR